MDEDTQNTVQQLVELAKDSKTNFEIDWNTIQASEDETYFMMAANVLRQIESIPEEHRIVVAMSTMTKLLVENFAFSLMLNGEQNDKVS